jgi:hypothetical protein
MKPAPNLPSHTQPAVSDKGISLWTRLNRELGAATTPRRPGVQGRWKASHRVSLYP